MMIRSWKQHTLKTCGVACLMMVLDAYHIERPTISKEYYFDQRLRSKAAPGTEGGAIAVGLAKYGLQVLLAFSGAEIIDDREGYYPPEMRQGLLEENRVWFSLAPKTMHIQPECAVDAPFLTAHLTQRHLIIAQICIPGDADGMHDHVLHGVLLYGMEGEDVLYCDPLKGKLRIPMTKLLSLMDTPVGRMAIVAWRQEAGA